MITTVNASAVQDSTERLSFASLSVKAGSAWNTPVELAGQQWRAVFWESPLIRKLVRSAPAGEAEINERGDGQYLVAIRLPGARHTGLAKTFVQADLLEAARMVEAFQWEFIEHAGHRWYLTGDRAWTAVLGDGDSATVWQSTDQTFFVKRNLSPRKGVHYEMTATFTDVGEAQVAIRTFAEAAAIAVTLPTFLAVLGADTQPGTGGACDDQNCT